MIDPGCFSGRNLTSQNPRASDVSLSLLFAPGLLPSRHPNAIAAVLNCGLRLLLRLRLIRLCLSGHVSTAHLRLDGALARLRPSAAAHQRRPLRHCCWPTTRCRCQVDLREPLWQFRGDRHPEDPQLQEVQVQRLAHNQQGLFVLCGWNNGSWFGRWSKSYCAGYVNASLN
jgi:hypothetical protein